MERGAVEEGEHHQAQSVRASSSSSRSQAGDHHKGARSIWGFSKEKDHFAMSSKGH